MALRLLEAMEIDLSSQTLMCVAEGGDGVQTGSPVATARGKSYKPVDESAYAFKCAYQLNSLFKKYTFENDVFTQAQLRERAEAQFLSNQRRLDALSFGDGWLSWLLFTAKGVCSEILGTYDLEEHIDRCRHAKKATVGIPMRKACLAERYEVPISGSDEHIAWFRDVYLPEVETEQSYIAALVEKTGKPAFSSVHHLSTTFVPKTYKSLRSITPDTTLGAFYSNGLGKMIASRLQKVGIDIRTQQSTHRDLAKLASETGWYVTADQSMASDNITTEVVRRIVPADWFAALNLGRIGTVVLPSGKKEDLRSFSTMGIGFTFALQTLVFYAFLEAIRRTYRVGLNRKLSVFGDDLIYATEMHPFVKTVFPLLGFQLNDDKTFADGPFRESCGSDFFHGLDVRPAFIEPHVPTCRRNTIRATLFKWWNSIMRRWCEEELPTTSLLIVSELRNLGACLFVPSDYPDFAGIKVGSPPSGVIRRTRHGGYLIECLEYIPTLREERRHEPYVWNALDRVVDSTNADHVRVLRDSGTIDYLRTIEEATGIRDTRLSTFTRCRGTRKGYAHSVERHRKGRLTGIPENGGPERYGRRLVATPIWR
jgi:hypothetical protein